MSQLSLSRKPKFPSWPSSLLDPETLFTPGFLDFDGDFPFRGMLNRVPSVNILENEKEFKFEMAVPGFERKEFKVEVENGILFIKTEKEEEIREDKFNFTLREFAYNKFHRSFTLPENCMPENIQARYENGILNIILPKKEVTMFKPAREIKVS